MSLPGIAEQITLDSGEANAVSITPDKNELKNVTLELAQTSKLHKTLRHIRVYDHKVLYIKEKVGKQGKHILLDLSLIDDNPVRIRDFNTATLITAAAISIMTCIAFYIHAKGFLKTPDIFMYIAMAILAIAAIACFVLTAQSYIDTWIFKTAHGKVPILTLYSNAPNKATFQQFTKNLMKNIGLARSDNSAPESKLLPAIVGEHRRMFEKGLITEEQFEQAKKNILSNKQ